VSVRGASSHPPFSAEQLIGLWNELLEKLHGVHVGNKLTCTQPLIDYADDVVLMAELFSLNCLA